MSPTCEILLESCDVTILDAVDSILSVCAEQVVRTRKGRVWEVWISGRPIGVSVDFDPPAIQLSAGCNSAEDYAVLERLCRALTDRLGGIASRPSK